ncbi:MAG TPA: hypothetical protein VES42_03865 [Pilimelia sp.]|nr:hypothetical protein [Pilimelia sp.]
MGIADSFKDLAERAKDKLSSHHTDTETDTAMTGGIDSVGDKFDNATGDRFGGTADRMQGLNERIDDFTGADQTARHNRDVSGA